VKDFVEAQGGIVEVFSKPGHGSTFRITFPFKAVSSPAISPDNLRQPRSVEDIMNEI
jgi:hypothetical protein